MSATLQVSRGLSRADLLAAFVHADRSSPVLYGYLRYRQAAAVACSGQDVTGPLDPVAGRAKP